VFVVAYKVTDKGARKVAPYTCGMYDYKLSLSCPYFDKYIDNKKAMFSVEVIGAVLLLVVFIGACAVAGVF
jgi:hypothetical protein